MRGHPEEQPVLSRSREEAACVSEEGQSFRERERERNEERRLKEQTVYFRKKQNNTIGFCWVDKM